MVRHAIIFVYFYGRPKHPYPVEVLFFNLLLIILLEYGMLLFFFKKEWVPCLQFSALVNAVTFFVGLYLVSKQGWHFAPVLAVIVALEAMCIYFFWVVKPLKALGVSVLANLVSRGFFQIVFWLGINIYPF